MPTVEIDGHRVTYEDVGLGLPVLLLPGLVGSVEWFKYQFTGLSTKYRIISCDLREVSRRPDYTMELLVEDVARFMAALRLHSAIIGGHSLGGLIAQEFALSYPQSTAAVVLASTFHHVPTEYQPRIPEILAPLETPAESPIRRLLGVFSGKRATDGEELEGMDWLAAHAPHLSRTTISTRLRLATDFDVSGRIGSITVPSLVLVGGDEDAFLLDSARDLYESIPDSALEVIEGGDHFSFFTRHDLFNAALDDFLASRSAILA